MQEKVHFTPTEVKLFRGKLPPTSWFNENIVRFFQIKNEQEFLSDFVSFLQQAATDKLSKNKQEGKPILEFAYVPEGEGTADEIANAATYNLLQMHLGTQIQFLMKLINILKSSNPKMASELDRSLNQLNELVKAFPKPSKDQLAFLGGLIAKLSEMAEKMSPGTQKSFWDEVNKMLEKMITTNSSTMQQYKDEMSHAQNKMQEMEQFRKGITSLLKLLSSGQIPQGLSQFLSLLKNYKKLSPDLQKTLGAALSKAGKMKGENNLSLAQLLAETQLNQWIKKLDKKSSRQHVVEYINKQMKEPPFNTMSPPFIAIFLGAIHHRMDNPNFPSTTSALGAKYDEVEDVSHAITAFQFDPISAKNASTEVDAYFTRQQEQYEGQIEGLKQAIDHSGNAGDHLGRSAAYGAATAAKFGSLPSRFQHTIIGHYMPGQEKYLMELAEILMFSNMGASIGNSLLTIITDFSSAATNFNFSNFLHSDGKGQFNGTSTQAQNQLSKETSQAYKDLQELKHALSKINSEIKKIETNKKLTASQKKGMISKLQSIKGNLSVAQEQMQNLYKLLKQIHIHPGSDSKHFKVTGPSGWEKSLSHDENLAINGNPKSKPSGGLVQIATEINTFQQTYSDQGQNQQMMLQMRMTEIQQEWTVVSTALQLLNQMYMSVAQGIYK